MLGFITGLLVIGLIAGVVVLVWRWLLDRRAGAGARERRSR